MADKPVSAEEVIEAARGFLKATLNNAFDFDDKRLYDEHAERLEDLLTQYDAQPKQRWLKPEEVTESGDYYPLLLGTRRCPWGFLETPVRIYADENNAYVHRDDRDGGDYFVKYEKDRLFYGPLPEPPPPEEK